MLTFAMWRDGHCLGLEELLMSLRRLIETYEWRLTGDWLIPEIEIPGDVWLTMDQVFQ